MTIPLHLIAFPGAPNLPIIAGMELGYFEDAGVRVDLTTTPTSSFQMEKLAAGEFDMAATAIDNVVAYREGQGAVAVDNAHELFVFMGATNIELSFVVAPDIETYGDLKGRTLALDALSTGFAFVLYQMLENAGLEPDDYEMIPVGATPDRWASVRDGTHAGTLTIEPFTAMARGAGFRVLETSRETFDHYQGGIFAARRDWAAANHMALVGFIGGYLKGLNWVRHPENRAAASDILARNMPAIASSAIAGVLENVLSPACGLTPLATLDMDGIRTVLDLRSRFGPPGTRLSGPATYMDLSFYQRALAAQ